MKYIDMHAHIAGVGAGNSGCYVSPAMRRSWKFKVYLKSFGVPEAVFTKPGKLLKINNDNREE